MDRHLEPHRPVPDLERDADLRIRPMARGRFDARHFDLELAHRLVLAVAVDPSPARRSARWASYANSRPLGSGARIRRDGHPLGAVSSSLWLCRKRAICAFNAPADNRSPTE